MLLNCHVTIRVIDILCILRTQEVPSGPPLPCGCNLVFNLHFQFYLICICIFRNFLFIYITIFNLHTFLFTFTCYYCFLLLQHFADYCWLCDYVIRWLCDYLIARIFADYVIMWLSDCPNICWLCDYVIIWLLEYLLIMWLCDYLIAQEKLLIMWLCDYRWSRKVIIADYCWLFAHTHRFPCQNRNPALNPHDYLIESWSSNLTTTYPSLYI